MDFDEILCDGRLYPGAYYRQSLNFQGGVLGGRAPQPRNWVFPQNILSVRYLDT